jgi:hypothetical protein
MVKVMTVVGRIINNMVKLNLQIKKDKVKMECGRMERESNGLTEEQPAQLKK